MTPDPHAARYEVCLYVITGLVEARSGMTEIEDVIETSDLPEEERSTLWLFARSLRSLRPGARDPNGRAASPKAHVTASIDPATVSSRSRSQYTVRQAQSWKQEHLTSPTDLLGRTQGVNGPTPARPLQPIRGESKWHTSPSRPTQTKTS